MKFIPTFLSFTLLVSFSLCSGKETEAIGSDSLKHLTNEQKKSSKKPQSEKQKRAAALLKFKAEYLAKVASGKIDPLAPFKKVLPKMQKDLPSLQQDLQRYKNSKNSLQKQQIQSSLLLGIQPIGDFLNNAQSRETDLTLTPFQVKEIKRLQKAQKNVVLTKDQKQRGLRFSPLTASFTVLDLPVPIVLHAPPYTKIYLESATGGRFPNGIAFIELKTDDKGIARDTARGKRKVKLQWYHKNYLDYVYTVSDDNGNLVEHYRYTAFGEPEIYSATGARRNTSAIANTVMWNTRRYDADNGLYYYKYRHYAANIGRWPGRDPIEESGGVNLYVFVGNQPTKWFDYLGLKKKRCCCSGRYLPLKKCCKDGKKADMRTSSINITVGHSHVIGPNDSLIPSPKLLDAIKNSKDDRMSCVTCSQQLTNSWVPEDRRYPNDERENELLYPGEGNNFRSELEQEIEAAKKEAKKLCEQPCVKSVKIKPDSVS